MVSRTRRQKKTAARMSLRKLAAAQENRELVPSPKRKRTSDPSEIQARNANFPDHRAMKLIRSDKPDARSRM